ncbi:hypothetical protein EC12741_0062 [Escherichia coli 1.2741]|nr:hypothetical protein ECSTEC7V_0055 [Escherichia coli STEC_7v]EIG84220.1 hypothetical protein EC12741_0062 [Escherichia coli 1.2741]
MAKSFNRCSWNNDTAINLTNNVAGNIDNKGQRGVPAATAVYRKLHR